MKFNRLFLITLFCAVIFSACKRETEVSGEVFVVTKGAGNYKFGLVEVSVIPLDEAKKLVRSQQGAVEKAWSEALAYDKKCDGWEKDFSKYEADYKTDKILSECRATAQNDKDAVYAVYFLSLPQPVATAATDSDGKFTLKIPEPGNYAVAAKAERTTGGERREQYFWLYEIKADGESQKLTLSNNNMIVSNAPASLIKAGS